MGYNLATTRTTYGHNDNQDWLASAEGVDRGDSVTLDAGAALKAYPTGEVPSGVEISRNATTGRYVIGVRGAQAALAAPTGVTATTSAGGGVLAAGTYSYRVSALSDSGETIPSTPAATVTTVGTTSTVQVAWATVTGAVSYKVYGRVGGSELLLATVTETTYLDTGRIAPSGAIPTTNTTASAATDRPGFLLFGVVVKPTIHTTGALLWHGEVILAKVPMGIGVTAPLPASHPLIRLV